MKVIISIVIVSIVTIKCMIKMANKYIKGEYKADADDYWM